MVMSGNDVYFKIWTGNALKWEKRHEILKKKKKKVFLEKHNVCGLGDYIHH